MCHFLGCSTERNRGAHQGKVGVMDPTEARSLVISVVDLDILCGQPRFALATRVIILFGAFPFGTDVDSRVGVVIKEGLNNALGCMVPIVSDVRDDEGSEVFGLDVGDDGKDAGHARILVQWEGGLGVHHFAFLSPATENISEG